MNTKLKGRFSIFIMSVLFYMMVTTKYTHALGDYILEFIGLKSWIGDYSGTHLTVIYFGILFTISLFLVRKFAVNGLKISKKKVFIIFVALMIVFYSITGIVVKNIKKNSSGLLAIGCNLDNSNMVYSCENNEYIDFIAEFELTNYSKEKKTFYISIDSPFFRSEDIEKISFYTFENKQAIFELKSNETKFFSLSSENYNVMGGRKSLNGGGSGIVQEIILTNDKGEKIRLDGDNGFVIVLDK